MSKKYDDFFKEIMKGKCDCPKKKGVSYEIISAAVLSIIKGVAANHNLYIKGYTGVKHQIDALLNKTLVEAKDKVDGCKKVGIDIAKVLQANLVDIADSEDGYLVTNVGFTSPVVEYKNGASNNPNYKPISLFLIRISDDNDLKNRITSFKLKTTIERLILDKLIIKFKNIDAAKIVSEEFKEKKWNKIKETYFTNPTNDYINIEEEYMKGWPNDYMNVAKIQSSVRPGMTSKYVGFFKEPSFFVCFDKYKFEIDSIRYEYLYQKNEMEDTIKPNGKPCVLVKSDDKKINKLITDENLRNAIISVVKKSKEYSHLLKK